MTETNVQLEKDIFDALSEAGLNVARLDNNRNYWFIRTDGGNYFDAYITGGYVAIGWNDVPYTDKDNYTDELIADLTARNYGQPTRVLNQIYRFYNEMKKGDIVFIPSTASLHFAFGYIVDDAVYEEYVSNDDVENGACPYIRRRKVEWFTNIPKARMDPNLYALFKNHQAISDGKNYAEYIDRAINIFYIKNNVAHFTLTANALRNPKVRDIPWFLIGLTEYADKFAHEYNLLNENQQIDDDISSRINIQSPGVIEFIGSPIFLAILAIVFIGLFGGKAKFEQTKTKTSGEISTEGLAGFVTKILQINADVSKERLSQSKNSLGIEDIVKSKDDAKG